MSELLLDTPVIKKEVFLVKKVTNISFEKNAAKQIVTEEIISNTINGGKENCGADHTCVLVVHRNQLFMYCSMPGINDDFNKEDIFFSTKTIGHSTLFGR